MGQCRCCRKKARTVSNTIGFCAECIRTNFENVWPDIKRVHDRSRKPFDLPEDPPRADGVAPCPLCFHSCRIPEGEQGYCGLRRRENGLIQGGRPHEGNLSWYHDPLPTNCVGSFACPAGTDCGYPEYSTCRGPEFGRQNLAVFYRACAFNCLYCQNYHFKDLTLSRSYTSARFLADAADTRTTCICYFGGDPTPQILHALKTSRLARNKALNRPMRICWETNGSVREPFLSKMAGISLESGGLIKIDLKAWHPEIHRALCGVDNQRTLENFQSLAGYIPRRPTPHFLIASTLLVPGYVDVPEIEALAGFIAGLNPDIPYSLLAFYPTFYLRDLPVTSKKHADRCRRVALQAGLKTVHIGNIHLLGRDYD